MKKQIAEKLYDISSSERDQFIDEYELDIRKSRKWDDLPDSPSKEYWREKADQILKEIREETEKGLLTTQEARDVCTQVAIDYGELGGKATEQSLAEAFKRIAQAQLDKVLKALES